MSNIEWTRYSPIFQAHEFECRCGCGRLKIDPELIEMLYEARLQAGIPFVVTSGYRCPAHNGHVGGVSGSAHTLGKAADIRANSMVARMKVLDALLRVGFPRVGIAREFLHCDVDWEKPLGVYLYA